MPIAKITGQGLFAIACSVALLWSCLIGERMMLRHADGQRLRVLHEMQQMQRARRPNPATPAMPASLRRSQITVG